MERLPLARPQPRVPPNLQFPLPDIVSRERVRRRCRQRFAEFVKEAWKIVEPATPLVWNWHMEVVCDHVQALVEGKLGRQNLIINVPPGTSKSTIVSVCLLPWIWTWHASYRAVFASGNPRVSSRDSVKRRMILEDPWYRKTFNITWKFRKDQNEKLSYSNTATGVCLATTTGAKVTGERYHGLYVDDALDATEAFSQVEVDGVNTWWDQSFYNRVADEQTSTRCVIGQRLREDDLPGHLIERDGLGAWEWLVIPQIWDDEAEKSRRTTLLGWTDPRKEGELLFAQRYPKSVVEVAKLILGRSGYEGQHQQRPSLLQGEIFARGHAQFIRPAMIPTAKIIQRILSLDAAIKIEEENDYSVLLEAWEFDQGVFIAACLHEKLQYTGLKEAVMLRAAEVNPHALLIEDKASGQNLIQEYQNTGKFPVVPIMPLVDKVARARPLTPYWEANRVFFPCDDNGLPLPWVNVFLKELYSFPKSVHDDQVDAFTQLLQYLFLAPGARGLLDYYAASQAADAEKAKAQKDMDAIHHPIDFVALNGAKTSAGV